MASGPMVAALLLAPAAWAQAQPGGAEPRPRGAQPQARGGGGEPSEVVQRMVNQALEVLRDPQLQAPHRRAERLQRLRGIADQGFDWEAMAQRSIGPHWRTATEAEQERFIRLFEEILANRYMRDIDRFRGTEQVQITGTAPLDEDIRRVETVLVTHGRERIPIHYVMHQRDGRWRAFDVSIEGVSLVGHYRQTFGRFLANNPFGELLNRLEQQTGPGAAQRAEGPGGGGEGAR